MLFRKKNGLLADNADPNTQFHGNDEGGDVIRPDFESYLLEIGLLPHCGVVHLAHGGG